MDKDLFNRDYRTYIMSEKTEQEEMVEENQTLSILSELMKLDKEEVGSMVDKYKQEELDTSSILEGLEDLLEPTAEEKAMLIRQQSHTSSKPSISKGNLNINVKAVGKDDFEISATDLVVPSFDFSFEESTEDTSQRDKALDDVIMNLTEFKIETKTEEEQEEEKKDWTSSGEFVIAYAENFKKVKKLSDLPEFSQWFTDNVKTTQMEAKTASMILGTVGNLMKMLGKGYSLDLIGIDVKSLRMNNNTIESHAQFVEISKMFATRWVDCLFRATEESPLTETAKEEFQSTMVGFFKATLGGLSRQVKVNNK